MIMSQACFRITLQSLIHLGETKQTKHTTGKTNGKPQRLQHLQLHRSSDLRDVVRQTWCFTCRRSVHGILVLDLETHTPVFYRKKLKKSLHEVHD